MVGQSLTGNLKGALAFIKQVKIMFVLVRNQCLPMSCVNLSSECEESLDHSPVPERVF